MPGGIPLATCTLPIGVFYLLTTYELRAERETGRARFSTVRPNMQPKRESKTLTA